LSKSRVGDKDRSRKWAAKTSRVLRQIKGNGTGAGGEFAVKSQGVGRGGNYEPISTIMRLGRRLSQETQKQSRECVEKLEPFSNKLQRFTE
jgi:hypothetical protein